MSSVDPDQKKRMSTKLTILIVISILLAMMACGGVPLLVYYVCFMG